MLDKEGKLIGVYSIVSPSNKKYIGSSIDIKRRWAQYKGFNCKKQTILYRSLLKYGYENHTFKIILECKKEDLLEYEIIFSKLYNVLGENGLNCRIPNNKKDSIMSWRKESLDKLSNSKKGIKFSEEHKANLRKAKIGYRPCDSTMAKLHKAAKENRVFTKEHRLKLRNGRLGYKMSKESREKLSASKKGTRLGCLQSNSKMVLNLENGLFYHSMSSAAETYNISKTHLSGMLKGERKNKTPLVLV